MILSRLVYDAFPLSVAIYKISKYIMPSVLKSVEILKVVQCIPALRVVNYICVL